MEHLTLGLEFFIARVEMLPQSTQFDMECYSLDPVGQTIGYPEAATQALSEAILLKNYFGISMNRISHVMNPESRNKFTWSQWEVIELFTIEIGEQVSRDAWLALAKETLESLRNI